MIYVIQVYGQLLVNWIETLVYCQCVKVDNNNSDNSKNVDIYRFETLDLITNLVLLQSVAKKAVKLFNLQINIFHDRHKHLFGVLIQVKPLVILKHKNYLKLLMMQ